MSKTTTTQAKKIVYLPVDNLDPHPDNPRGKNLGDLTELADSIKANGILQNLTVVLAPPWDDNALPVKYTVIIGHRRLAAAKLAGLGAVPCIIADMTPAEQVRTMLMENMQRVDLTPYEQAQGFQLMMDLGDTAEEISDRTGFSRSTVYRRVKLLEFDKELFAEAEERGATMWEYMELDKIEDAAERNALLNKAGTDNFKFALKAALQKQELVKIAEAIEEVVATFATKIEDSTGYIIVTSFCCNPTAKPEDVIIPDDADSTEYFYVVRHYGYTWVYVYKVADDDADDNAGIDKATAAERAAKEAARRVRAGELTAITERMYELRYEFVKSVSTAKAKKHMAEIISFDIGNRVDSYSKVGAADMMDLLGLTAPEADEDAEGRDEDEAIRVLIKQAAAEAPERAALLAAYCQYKDSTRNGFSNSYSGEHKSNEGLDELYDLLVTLGYKMSDEEKAMRNGTHVYFDYED